jgi:hypothetical protein
MNCVLITQKTTFFIVTAVKTSNLTFSSICSSHVIAILLQSSHNVFLQAGPTGPTLPFAPPRQSHSVRLQDLPSAGSGASRLTVLQTSRLLQLNRTPLATARQILKRGPTSDGG